MDDALTKTESQGHKVPHVLVYDNARAAKRAEVKMVKDRDVWWDEAIGSQSTQCEPVWLDAEAPLFKLYTSGSTGKPKGVEHTQVGVRPKGFVCLERRCMPACLGCRPDLCLILVRVLCCRRTIQVKPQEPLFSDKNIRFHFTKTQTSQWSCSFQHCKKDSHKTMTTCHPTSGLWTLRMLTLQCCRLATWSARPPRSSMCLITAQRTYTGARPTAGGSLATPT